MTRAYRVAGHAAPGARSSGPRGGTRRCAAVVVVLLELLVLGLHPLLHRERCHGASPGTAAAAAAGLTDGDCPICRVSRHRTPLLSRAAPHLEVSLIAAPPPRPREAPAPDRRLPSCQSPRPPPAPPLA